MINKDRIVPITRTDLLSFFAVIYNAVGRDHIQILQVEDGAVTMPDEATGPYLAAEPLKTLPTIGEGAQLYFVPAYDFEMTLTPADDAPEFVPYPGNICVASNGRVFQLDIKKPYTVA